MPFLVKSVPPERALVIICHVIAFAVCTFEFMRAWFACLCFKPWGVNFVIYLTTPSHIFVVFKFMRTIALLTFRSVYFARESQVTPFPAIVVLRNTWIHVSHFNSSYMSAEIEKVVN